MKFGNKNVITIGITGTIGVGKSLAGQMLEDLGIPVIDTDKIVHELLAANKEVKNAIKCEFPDVIEKSTEEKDQEINRKKLADKIFSDKVAKIKLENILHPKVRDICRRKTLEIMQGLEAPAVIVSLVPLLFEAKRSADYDQIWTIYCEEDKLRQRLMKRNGYTEEEINLRLAGQLPQREKIKLAHKSLDNSKDENNLKQQILENLKELKISLPSLNNNLKG